MSQASCLKIENNSKLNGVVFELILTYSLQIECHFNHYLAKCRFEVAERSRWLHHLSSVSFYRESLLSWTAVTNYFPSAGFRIGNIVNNNLQMCCLGPKLELGGINCYFYGFYRCVNPSDSLKMQFVNESREFKHR